MGMVVRSPAYMKTEDGKNVELRMVRRDQRETISTMSLYMDMVLGGVDFLSLTQHASGRIKKHNDFELPYLEEKTPGVVEAAERRFGKLVALLKVVKEEMGKAEGDGPWVLQWRRNKIMLGRYEDPPEPEEEEDLEQGEVSEKSEGELVIEGL